MYSRMRGPTDLVVQIPQREILNQARKAQVVLFLRLLLLDGMRQIIDCPPGKGKEEKCAKSSHPSGFCVCRPLPSDLRAKSSLPDLGTLRTSIHIEHG